MNKLLIFLSMAVTAAPALAGVVDQETYDVRLVAAEITGDVITIGEGADAQVKPASCREVERHAEWHTGVHIYDDVTLDCTDALAAALHAPLLQDLRVYAPMQNGSLKLVNPSWKQTGRRVDVYTAVRNAALAPAAGIGFFYGSGERFIPKDRFQSFTWASSWEGEAVTVQRFAAFFSGAPFESLVFKPYVRYDDGGTQFRNWENMSPRAGSSDVTGGFGTGNYVLTAEAHEVIRFGDVIRELERIPVARRPAAPRLDQEVIKTDVVTITHRSGRPVEAEVALFPYVYGVDLQWDAATVQVEAGKEVWLRYAGSAGQGVQFFYSIAGGAEQEAGYMMGGNCFGFDKCFKILVPVDASGEVRYRFSSGWEGTFTVAGQDAKTLTYDAADAVRILGEAGVIPRSVSLVAVLTAAGGEELRVPVGQISTWRDKNQQLIYQAKMAQLKLSLPEIAEARVEIKAWLVNGTEQILVDEDAKVFSP